MGVHIAPVSQREGSVIVFYFHEPEMMSEVAGGMGTARQVGRFCPETVKREVWAF